MICKQCQDQGTKSRVTPLGGTETLLGFNPYYDEEGRYHSHDPNTFTGRYKCSNDHEWIEQETTPCPAPSCDWNKK